jgi:hypothetical protein
MTTEYAWPVDGFQVAHVPAPRRRHHAPWYQPTYRLTVHKLDDCLDLLPEVKARLLAERDADRVAA